MKKKLFKYAIRPLLSLIALYWFVFRPETTGVKCVIRCGEKILLIKNSYGADIWTLPGGGVRRNELLSDAVVREVLEEVGIAISRPKSCGSIFYDGEYKRNTVWVFLAEVNSCEAYAQSVEVDEAQWFFVQELPKNKSHLLLQYLELTKCSKV